MPIPHPLLREHPAAIRDLLAAVQATSGVPVSEIVALLQRVVPGLSDDAARSNWGRWRSGRRRPNIEVLARLLLAADQKGWLEGLPKGNRELVDQVLVAARLAPKEPTLDAEKGFEVVVQRFKALVDQVAKEPRNSRKTRGQVKDDLLVALRKRG